jgi:hypothetical protein
MASDAKGATSAHPAVPTLNNHLERFMNKLVKFGLAAVLAGSATLSAAQQQSATRFADEFAYLQSLSGSSASQFYHPAPSTFNSTSRGPAIALTVAAMQRLSNSRNALYAPEQFNVHPDKGPTFASANPRGLSFSFYQAASSNSDEWKLPAYAWPPTYATASGSSAVASGAPATTTTIARTK